MINQFNYLNQLIQCKDQDCVKIVTGIRGCGKSTVFDWYSGYLRLHGVRKEQIIRVNLEKMKFRFGQTGNDLYDYIERFLLEDKQNYVFLEEIQTITNFENCVEALFAKKNVDLYLNGSSRALLSEKLTTCLAGKYYEIPMLPLSFSRYISSVGDNNLPRKYFDYITQGSLPYVIKQKTKKEKMAYLEGIYHTILIKDIAQQKKGFDFEILETILKFMVTNIGKVYSSTKIANDLALQGKKISVPTIENYLKALTNAFLFNKVERYDITKQQPLLTGAKYYATDIALGQYFLGNPKEEAIFENVVYLELLRRGYHVNVGKINKNEVDFVAHNEEEQIYFQIADTVYEEIILKKELKPFESIHDHHPKYLLTMDVVPSTSHNGIKQINGLEWLLGKK